MVLWNASLICFIDDAYFEVCGPRLEGSTSAAETDAASIAEGLHQQRQRIQRPSFHVVG